MQNKKLLWTLSFLLLILIFVAYAKHFDNEFHFDDAHTIQNNAHIQDLKNIPKFFTVGAETFSSLPENQLYRPVVSTTIAIDFWLSEQFYPEAWGFDTHPYHWSMFLEYLILLVLLFFFVKKIFDKVVESDWNIWFALFATAWYGLHTVNAETLNYIISRSDLLSTLFVIASFVIYQYAPNKRKYGLFFIPFVFGVFTKLTAAMFVPLFFVYYVFLELPERVESLDGKKAKQVYYRRTLLQALIPFFLFIAGIYFIISNQADTYTTGGSDRLAYLITQPFVVFHYFISFFYPYLLSADTDWNLIPLLDIRFFVGMAFVLGMLFIVYKTAFKKHLRPIAFGILWFFVALAPTSSVIALAEVMNDHRMMFPFVGLLISVVWSLKLLFEKYKEKILGSFAIKNLIVLGISAILIGHMFGTIKRVEVWDNGESLWYDVTVKSPKNGRGLMNYGLKKMAIGDYEKAMEYFTRALEYSPYYSYLYTNIAIAQNEMGEQELSEQNHVKAIQMAPSLHKSYFYYGNFLKEHLRYDEAITNYTKSMSLAPQFIYTRYALLEIYSEQSNWTALAALANESHQMFPKNNLIKQWVDIAATKQQELDIKDFSSFEDVSQLIQLSLEYYNMGDFVRTIMACERALEIEPENGLALNNMCSAYNILGHYDLAMAAGQKAITLDPENQLAKNNLAVSIRRNDLVQQSKADLDLNGWINLSVSFYNEQMYQKCIEASEKAIELDANNQFAYNNICSAYNALQQYEKAAEACKKSLEINPEFEHAKNNLKVAEDNL